MTSGRHGTSGRRGRAGQTAPSMLLAAILTAAMAAACGGSAIRPVNTDASISTRVRTALLNDTQVAATGINVTANNGVVTLSGSVRTAAERERAVAVARQTSGVADVRSELSVAQP